MPHQLSTHKTGIFITIDETTLTQYNHPKAVVPLGFTISIIDVYKHIHHYNIKQNIFTNLKSSVLHLFLAKNLPANAEQKFFILIESSWSIISFIGHAFGAVFEKSNSSSPSFFPVLPSRSFSFLHLRLKIHDNNIHIC